MKIPLNDIVRIYENLISEINIAEVSVIMFTSLDVDALCTLKILSKFMKSENIEYKVYPVSTYTELEKKIDDCKAYEKVKLFFFINCGGLIDLTEKWFNKQSTVFLFDVHKPIHHENIEGDNVKIIDDFQSGFENAPTAYEMEVYQNMDDDFMEELEERNEGEREGDSDEEDLIARKRRRVRTAEHQMQKIQKIRKIKSEITEKVQLYYSHQFFGLPSSYLAYRLIKDRNKHNNQYLWYAMVGITANFLEQKINKEDFEKICDFYRSDMLRFNHQSEGRENQIEINSLKRKLDFQFPVYRHWSLYESILNSPYMISKLALWEQSGISKLHEFINRVGLSLEEAKQIFKFMPKDSVTKLENNIFEVAENDKFNLLDITFHSFAKQVDYCVELTASDFYYGLVSALEAPLKNKKMTSLEELLDHRVNCFWDAYVLFEAKQTSLKQSIEEYKKFQTIMTKEAKNIIERNHIMNGQQFSFVNFPNDTSDRKIFQHPFTLIKLAYMLMNMNKEKRKMKVYKPFIASLQNNENNTSLMVGVMSEGKNSFSSKFNFVVEKLKVEVRIDSFMGNIMLVPKQAMIKVIRELGEL